MMFQPKCHMNDHKNEKKNNNKTLKTEKTEKNTSIFE